MTFDTIIAGAGLAGACAALVLSRDRNVLVLEARRPASGASGAAAGLVNPFMGRGSRPAWRHRDALAALVELLDEADAANLLSDDGLIRPVRSVDRLNSVRRAAREHPDELRFLSPENLATVAPGLVAPLGALHVLPGGSVAIPQLVDAFLRAAVLRGAEVRSACSVLGWSSIGRGVVVRTQEGDEIARHMILATGPDVMQFPGCKSLPLHAIKGQTLVVERPTSYSLPPVSGPSYIVPAKDCLVIGASFEHSFTDLRPSRAVTETLLAQAIEMVPSLRGVNVLNERAGVRLTIPASYAPGRLPLLAELPGHPNVWVFAGLGAKGLMTAPLLAASLPDVLDKEASVHADLARLGGRS